MGMTILAGLTTKTLFVVFGGPEYVIKLGCATKSGPFSSRQPGILGRVKGLLGGSGGLSK